MDEVKKDLTPEELEKLEKKKIRIRRRNLALAALALILAIVALMYWLR